MTELLTAAQMRAIEQAAIASGEVTGLELMERAGRGVVDAIFTQWPAFAPAAGGARGPAPSADASPPEYFGQDDAKVFRAVVLCGPGNNGGDGFVVARLLREAGWDVDVFLYGDAGKLPPDARVNYERWVKMGEVGDILTGFTQTPNFADTDVIVDALFGIGLSRGLVGPEDVFWPIFDRMPFEMARKMMPDVKRARLVSVDIPSGVCADSGRILWGAEDQSVDPIYALADLTVTFHRLKQGHFLCDGDGDCCGAVGLCGEISIVDIGLKANSSAVIECTAITSLLKGSYISLSKVRFGRGISHKYTHGHALILAGSVGKGGAARLAARGALRVGAGAVTLGVQPAALVENAAQLNAVMLTTVTGQDDFSALLKDGRINALCLGPGFGTNAREVALVGAAIAAERSLVLDADALTILAQNPDLFVQLHPKCVLTPHAGEFARLFPDIAAKLDAPAMTGPAYSKVDATREAAALAGCVVLFKGPDTVIATPGGRCSINASVYERAAPWLATAGSGDVLAGFITGLLARGFDPMQAAEAGAWLHTECALKFGPGLIAEDLPDVLPAVLSDLEGEMG